MTVRKIIDSFTVVSGYGFLSNFHTSTVTLDGDRYPTVEHAYQASKSTDPGVRAVIRRAKSPGEAKKLGRAVQIRPDWDDVKVGLMKSFVREKFSSPFLAHELLKTGDSELVYGNTWNDRFWGVCRGAGQNWLGRILMEVRDELHRNLDNSAEVHDETSCRGEAGPEDEAR